MFLVPIICGKINPIITSVSHDVLGIDLMCKLACDEINFKLTLLLKSKRYVKSLISIKKITLNKKM